MQSTMCIPLWPARSANTAHLVMCLSLVAAVARFATGEMLKWRTARFPW